MEKDKAANREEANSPELGYADKDVPEIDYTRFRSNAADQIPEEMPQRRNPSK